MNHLDRMLNNLKFLINAATAQPGLDPKSLSRKILLSLFKEKNTAREEREITLFIEERRIRRLLHFTRLENLAQILTYGLIPRVFLEKEAIRIALKPVFSDDHRFEGKRDANCLSISFPNYKMFYKKREVLGGKWVVVILSARVLTTHKCHFAEGNSARTNSHIQEGVAGARRLFCDRNLRQQLRLPPEYPTNPQSEVLEYSVIPPYWIDAIHVKDEALLASVQKLTAGLGIPVECDDQYFRPRHDYRYWQINGSTDLVDDYPNVLEWERTLAQRECF